MRTRTFVDGSLRVARSLLAKPCVGHRLCLSVSACVCLLCLYVGEMTWAAWGMSGGDRPS
jgi:hypothetical protein